jgi:hypothetical protein
LENVSPHFLLIWIKLRFTLNPKCIVAKKGAQSECAQDSGSDAKQCSIDVTVAADCMILDLIMPLSLNHGFEIAMILSDLNGFFHDGKLLFYTNIYKLMFLVVFFGQQTSSCHFLIAVWHLRQTTHNTSKVYC